MDNLTGQDQSIDNDAYMKTIAFQGEVGAYSEEAILEHFPTSTAQTLPCSSFYDVFSAVSQRSADLGFIPIENSVAGSIYQVYDLLTRNNLWIVGEHYLRVNHCLIAQPGTAIQNIRKVISHPQALMQCDGYLNNLTNVQTEQVYDTAGSVKMLAEKNDPGLAAIASRRAAEIYGMAILGEGIEDDPANFTRFFIIARNPITTKAPAKTSIVFTLENAPGALFKTMSVFALRDIDLTKIDSRPLIGKPWDYLFYMDFRGAQQDPVIQRALENLDEYTLMLRVFGSYPDARK
jgi:prephenate dehydratase